MISSTYRTNWNHTISINCMMMFEYSYIFVSKDLMKIYYRVKMHSHYLGVYIAYNVFEYSVALLMSYVLD